MKIAKYTTDETLSYSERYEQLEAHHIEETEYLRSLIKTNEPVADHTNKLISNILQRPLMYGGDMHTVEMLLVYLLDIRALALGIERPDTHKWIATKYPKVPAPVRSLSYAIRWHYGEKEHSGMFKGAINKMVEELRAQEE